MLRVALPAGLELIGVPSLVADDRRIVVLLDRVVTGGTEVEVEPPVHVVDVEVARAAVLGPGEAEAGGCSPAARACDPTRSRVLIRAGVGFRLTDLVRTGRTGIGCPRPDGNR
jgi:hypothetical protein